jgi:hypothetical protein
VTSRLPIIGGDYDSWGTVLNDFLSIAHNADGTLNKASGSVFTLSAGTSVSATSATTVETLGVFAIGQLVAVDAGTVECELRIVTGVSGKTISFAALERTHSAGAFVYAAADSLIHPSLFACKGDNVTDDWQGFQCLLYQANKLLNNTIYGPTIDGGGLTYRVQQPLTFSKHTMRNLQINCYTTFSPADANNALMMCCAQAHFPVTVTASDDTFACLAGQVFPNVDDCIAFNNMYGETMPGGVTGGRVYFVKTKSGDQRSITVSATRGGATLNVTSDGAGWAAGKIGDITKFWWKDISLNVAIADLNGLVFGAQQPADIYRLRVNMTVACSRTTYGVALANAQIARIYNPEFVVDSATNVVALGIGVPFLKTDGSVTGVHVQDANFDGSTASGQTHMVIGGASVCDDVVVSGDTWLEGPGDAGIRLDAPARGVDLGHLYLSGNPTNGALYEATQCAWRVGQIFNSGSDHINVQTFDGVLFKTSGSADNVSADVSNVMGGMRRVASGVMPALALDGRLYTSQSSSVTAAWLWDTIDMDATAAIRTLTLPSAVGVATFRFTIRKKDSSGNAVTVATTSSQTINGSTTYSLATQYKYVTVESDGANWMVVANN